MGYDRYIFWDPKKRSQPAQRVPPKKPPMVLAFFDGTQWFHFEVRQWTAWIAPILRQFLDVGAAVEGQFDLMRTPR